MHLNMFFYLSFYFSFPFFYSYPLFYIITFFEFFFFNFTAIIDCSFSFLLGDGIWTEAVLFILDESDLWIGFKVIWDFFTLGGTKAKVLWFCFLLATFNNW